MKIEHDLVLQQPLPETVGAQQKRMVSGGKRDGRMKLGLDLVVADDPEQLAPALKGRNFRPGMQLAHFDGKLGEAVILRVVREDAVVEVVQPAVEEEATVYASVTATAEVTVVSAVQNDVETEMVNYKEGEACVLDENGNCLMCGS